MAQFRLGRGAFSRSLLVLGLFTSSFAAQASPAHAQSFAGDISLTGLGNGGDARPFGIHYEAGLHELYVGLAGSFSNPNDVVVIIDPTTDVVSGTIQAELFPEDVAFHHDPLTGQARYGIVTNSTTGSVTIWDAATRAVLANVGLPDPLGFGSCFPFGLAVDDVAEVAYVGTIDGSGDLHAVDLAALSHDPLRSQNEPGLSYGRLLLDQSTLIATASVFLPGFSGSTTELLGIDVGPLPVRWRRLLREETGAFSSGQDIVQLPNGQYLVAGLDNGFRLYLFDQGGVLLRTMRMSTSSGAQGLALDDAGELLAACDLQGNQLTLIDVVNWRELSVTALTSVGQGYQQPNDAAFVNGKLYVTCQSNEEVVVFDNLPTITPGSGYAGSIQVSSSTPFPGDSVDITLTGTGVVALMTAFDDQPGPYQGVDLDIGPNPMLAGWGQGSFTQTISVPPNPALRGRYGFAQGVIDATGNAQATEPRAAIVQ